jgi:hypothetical protein
MALFCTAAAPSCARSLSPGALRAFVIFLTVAGHCERHLQRCAHCAASPSQAIRADTPAIRPFLWSLHGGCQLGIGACCNAFALPGCQHPAQSWFTHKSQKSFENNDLRIIEFFE